MNKRIIVNGEYLKVSELIKILLELPQDADVYVYGDCGSGNYGGRTVNVCCKNDNKSISICGES